MIQLLGDLLDGDLLGVHGDLLGVVHVLPGQVLDLHAQRGAEEHGLPAAVVPEQLAHFLDIRVEAHVEQSVRLVDDEVVERSEVDLAGVLEVQDAARSADEDVAALLEHRFLLLVADAAVETADNQAFDMRAKLLGVLFDLHRQLTGRGDDQGLRGGLSSILGLRVLLKDREQVDSGLAAAGLRLHHDILARKGNGQDLFLDRGAIGETCVADSIKHRW